MKSTKPTLLLLHGAHHPAAVWDQVIALLSAKGYRCIAPELCFVGGSGKAISTWRPCIEQVQQLIATETAAGRDVVVVNHSLGGLPGCSAVEGYTAADPSRLASGNGRVRGIVQITGMTIRDAAHHHEVFKNIPSNPDENGWKTTPPLELVKKLFYHDLEPAEADYWVSTLKPNAGWLDRNADGLYPGYKDVPVWYLACDNDQMLPLAAQESFMDVIREVNNRLTVRHIDSGHSPLLKRPEITAEYVHEAVEDFVAERA